MADPAIVINPFAALTAVAGPAILTNACSVLALGTSNRLGRAVDRARIIVKEANALPNEDPERVARASQLDVLDIRIHMLLDALRNFYAALGLFASAALLSAIGSVLAMYDLELPFRISGIAALAAGVSAVGGLVTGCILMVRETRLAVRTLEEEARLRAHLRTAR